MSKVISLEDKRADRVLEQVVNVQRAASSGKTAAERLANIQAVAAASPVNFDDAARCLLARVPGISAYFSDMALWQEALAAELRSLAAQDIRTAAETEDEKAVYEQFVRSGHPVTGTPDEAIAIQRDPKNATFVANSLDRRLRHVVSPDKRRELLHQAADSAEKFAEALRKYNPWRPVESRTEDTP